MPRRKPLREHVLVNLGRRDFAKRRGKYITTEVASGRPMDLPKNYDHWRDGWSWASVEHVTTDPKHTGPAEYRFEDWQVARIVKVVAPNQ
jgi:hypothetical protein